MSNTISTGARVRLKSGGPVMTVEQVGDDGLGNSRVWCVWFDSKHIHQTKDFAPETLEPYD